VRVTLLDKDVEAGQQVVDTCGALGADARLVEVDLRDSDALSCALARVKREQPPVDVLIVNAGYDPRFTRLEMSEQQWNDLFQLNVTHYFVTCRELLPAMIANGGGSIIMTASHTVWLGKPDLIAYNSSKAAIVGFMRGLAEAVGRHRIRVNAVAPGSVLSPRVAAFGKGPAHFQTVLDGRRSLDPSEIAGGILFLSSNLASGVSGQTLTIDAGLACGNPVGTLPELAELMPKRAGS